MSFNRIITILTLAPICINLVIQAIEYYKVAQPLANGSKDWRSSGLASVVAGVALLSGVLTYFKAASSAALLLFVTLVLQVALIGRHSGERGGGANYFLIHLLWGCSWALLEKFQLGFTWIAAFSLMSYARAGWVKLRSQDWRNGRALSRYLEYTHYDLWGGLKTLIRHPRIERAVEWSTISFELATPLLLFYPQLFWPWSMMGVLFHFSNAWFMGLNRFFWTWVASYPAIYWMCYSRLNSIF